MTDRRRYGVIEVHRHSRGVYHLTISGQMWSEVEWSASRQAWCIQDAAGCCLTHVESIVATVADPAEAIRLAKRMIVDGRMPTPEDAAARRKRERDLGEPVPPIAERDGELIDPVTVREWVEAAAVTAVSIVHHRARRQERKQLHRAGLDGKTSKRGATSSAGSNLHGRS
jgi:hypothetical protein